MSVTKYRVYRTDNYAYCGERDTLAEAVEFAEKSPNGLDECLWATALAAGHCGGMYAPDPAGIESDEPVSWHGSFGWWCVVKTTYADLCGDKSVIS